MAKSPFSPFRPQAPLIALDRMGRMIEPGHLVTFHMELPPVFEVLAVQPVLDPSKQSQGAIQVLIGVQLPVRCAAGRPASNFIVVGETPARIAARVSQNGNAPAVTEPVAEQEAAGPRLVLTDTPTLPNADDAGVYGACAACAHIGGPVGSICTNCGGARYVAPSGTIEPVEE